MAPDVSVFVPNAPAVTNWTLVAAGAQTTSSQTTQFQVDGFSSIEITVAQTALTGLGGVLGLDVYVQKLLADGATWDDVAHFASFTGSSATKTLSFVNGGNTLNTQGSLALASNTVLTVGIGGYWRVAWVQSTTTQTSTFGIFGNFKQ